MARTVIGRLGSAIEAEQVPQDLSRGGISPRDVNLVSNKKVDGDGDPTQSKRDAASGKTGRNAPDAAVSAAAHTLLDQIANSRAALDQLDADCDSGNGTSESSRSSPIIGEVRP